MSDNQQKKEPDNFVDELSLGLKEAWDQTKNDLGEMRDMVGSGIKSYVGDPARDGINYARHEGMKFYKVVEDKVGSDRLIGASLGAWKVGGLASFFGPVAMIKGTVVGGVAGFVLGRKIKDWLDEGQNNEPPASAGKPPGDTPPDPKP